MKRDSRIKPSAALWPLVCLVMALSGAATAAAQDIDACMACHQDVNLVKKDASGRQHSLYVDKAAFEKSVHGHYACVDCHEGVQADSHPAGGIKDKQCADCHEEEAKKYGDSNHGRLVAAGNPNAPHCYDCHTMHAVLPADDALSTVNAANLHTTCGACHEEQAKPFLCGLLTGFVKGEQPAGAVTLTALASSIAIRVKGHGKVNLGCEYSTRDCSKCHLDPVNHGAAEIKPAVCITCHGQPKTGVVFGKLHRANVVASPFLSVLLALGYIAGIICLVFYFKAGSAVKTESGDQPLSEG